MRNKLIYLIIVIITIPCHIFSQGLFNNGALIVVQSTALVHIDGDANGNYTNQSNGANHGKIDNNGTIEVEGNWTNAATSGNVFINNTAPFAGASLVYLHGTTNQNVGTGASNLPTVFENVTLQNANGATMTVNNNQVNGTLTLTSGALRLNSNTLIENNTSASSIVRDGVTYNGYIVSETYDGGSAYGSATANTCTSLLQWNITTASVGNIFTIPFGTSTGTYIPFSAAISTAGAGTLSASTYHTTPANLPFPASPNLVTHVNDASGADNSANCVDRFWSVNFSGFTATLTFYYDALDLNGLTATDLLAQYWDPSLSPAGWIYPGLGTGAASNVNSVTGVSTSRDWTLSNKQHPLPIELMSFNAVCDGEKVNLNWATASETNNDFFTVERSKDASLWEDALTVAGAGTSNVNNYYAATDNQPIPGNSYYRLKQTDYDGTFTYSDIVPVGCDTEQGFELIAVRPSQQDHEIMISFNATEGEQYYFNLFDARGRLIKSLSEKAVAGYNEIHVAINDAAQGIYMITLQNSEKYFGQKILLK
jgi:hypothetical protein